MFADESPDQNLGLTARNLPGMWRSAGRSCSPSHRRRRSGSCCVFASNALKSMAAHGDSGSWVLAMPSSGEGLESASSA